MTNTETFVRELSYIKNNDVRNFVSDCLDGLPDYFREIGASTSGKYHPAYTLGEGGLIRHTQAAVAIAQDLFRAEMYDFTDDDKDYVTASLILHDGLKKGMWNEHTSFEHPLWASNYVLTKYLDNPLPFEITKITSAIASHMGCWNTSSYSNSVLPKPVTDIEKCVHLCDYLASRKHLIFDFDVYKEETEC